MAFKGKIPEEEAEYSGEEREYDQELEADEAAHEVGDGLHRTDVQEEEDYSLKFPKEYHAKTPANSKVVEQIVGHDGKI